MEAKTIPLVKEIYRTEGVKGFFKGYFLNLAVSRHHGQRMFPARIDRKALRSLYHTQ